MNPAEKARVRGRKPKIKPNQRAEILRMMNSGKTSAAEAARFLGFIVKARLD